MPSKDLLARLPALFLILGCCLAYPASLMAQTWPADPVEFAYQGTTCAYWEPTDAPAGEPLRVIVFLPGAGGGISRPGDLIDALQLRGRHAVLVTVAESYFELQATDLVAALRAAPHDLNIKDDIFLTGFSRGGQMSNRIFQQLPEGIMGVAPRNPGSVTLPSGKLYGSIGSNQGGWTDEEIGPHKNGPKWTGGPGEIGLGDPADPAAKDIPVLNIMGVFDRSRYPATHFFNMEMQHTFQSAHFNTLWSNNGHGVSDKNTLPMVDFLIRLEDYPDNSPPAAKIDGPRVIVLNPGTTHTLTATATDPEDDHTNLTYQWRQASVEDHDDFLLGDQFSYVPRYIDGVDGYIPMHRNAPIQPSGLSVNDSTAFEMRAVISETLSYTFTTPDVEESTPIFLEFKAKDSLGFAHTDSVLVVVNGPPRILEGPTDRRIVLQEEETFLRYRALDITSDTLQWSVDTAPAHGSILWDSQSGEFAELRYTPEAGFTGDDSMVLRVTDEKGLSSTLTVDLTVSNSALSIPAEMNALQQRSTDMAGSLVDGSTMELKTGPHPKWMDLRSAFLRFPLDNLAGDFVSAEARIHVNSQNQTGTDTITVYHMDAATYGNVDGLAYAWGIAAPLPGSEAIIGTFSVDGPGFYSLDVTSAVQAAIDAGETSLTLMYRSDSENGPSYASRHWTDPDRRPQLDVVSLAGEPEVPSFPTQPTDLTVTDGQTARFTVELFGIPLPEVKWQKDGVDLAVSDRIAAVDGTSLVIDPVLPADAGQYRAVATNSAGTTESDPATLSVNLIPPGILEAPTDIASVVNRTVSFSVQAEGSGPLQYQWAFNDSPIEGATEPDLSVGPLDAHHIGTYTVTVTNGAGSASASAELTVNMDGNFQVDYDPNSGSGFVPSGGEYPDGSTITVDFSPLPEHPDLLFGGWKTDPDGAFAEFRPDGQTDFLLDQSVTLYAHWVAPWIRIEHFDTIAQGNLAGQNGWTGDASTRVVADPTDSTNQVMRFAPNSNDNAVKILDPAIADQGQTTLFARIYFPDDSGRINQQIRLPDTGNIRIKFDNEYNDQPTDSLIQLFYQGQNENAETQVAIQRDTWYHLWIVLDYDLEQVKVYLKSHSDQTPVRLIVDNDEDASNYFFGAQGISQMTFIGWSNHPVLWDDFYVFPGGSRLDDPRQGGIEPTPQQSFSQWINTFAGDLSPEQLDPAANPSGDGIVNLIKFALGLDPRLHSDPANLPGISVQSDDTAPYLTLQTPRNPDAHGLEMWVEYSENMVDWFNGSDLVIVRDDPDQLTVRSAHPINHQKPVQFLRLKVEEQN